MRALVQMRRNYDGSAAATCNCVLSQQGLEGCLYSMSSFPGGEPHACSYSAGTQRHPVPTDGTERLSTAFS